MRTTSAIFIIKLIIILFYSLVRFHIHVLVDFHDGNIFRTKYNSVNKTTIVRIDVNAIYPRNLTAMY